MTGSGNNPTSLHTTKRDVDYSSHSGRDLEGPHPVAESTGSGREQQTGKKPFSKGATSTRPLQSLSLPDGEKSDTEGKVDFDALLAEARRDHRCAECGGGLEHWQRVTSAFCSPRCRYYEDPDRERAKAREYYAANRETVLAKAAARRGRTRPPAHTECSECGGPLGARQRVVCSQRCRDRRYRRLHPVEYTAKEARKVERRRERRRAAAEGQAT
jgi:endogenous inhibitor of DNA gyrase (YacG/DUF329 family)